MKIKINGLSYVINLKKKKSKFDLNCERLENEEYIKNLSYAKRCIPEMSDYELLEYYRECKKCYAMIEDNPQRFAYLENELCKRGFCGLTTFKKIIPILSLEDMYNLYANAGLFQLQF